MALLAPIVPNRSPFRTLLVDRQLTEYPRGSRRVLYLGVVVLASIVLWYQYYVVSAVALQLLPALHMSFHYFILITVISSFAGMATGLASGVADRVGRTWMVIGGLLAMGLVQLVFIPNVTTKGPFTAAVILVGLFEGGVLVATPALVRDFTPQLGRASAMGFWTLGPVAGVLTASLVANHTLAAGSADWQRQFIISGVAGLAVFGVALFSLRELSPGIRDQLMHTRRDRELVELRARGIDVSRALEHPWRQMVKADIVVSAFAISLFLMIYYTASALFPVFLATVFHRGATHFSLAQANGIDTWIWATTCGALIVFGILSDLLRVRKPFMLVGGLGTMVGMLILIAHTGHPGSSYSTLVWIGSLLFAFEGMAYATWMASFTETVEARNPALTATGLAIWGGMLRLVVAVMLLVVPYVIGSVTQIANNVAYEKYIPRAEAILHQHGAIIAVVEKHAALFQKLAAYKNPFAIPHPLVAQAVAAFHGNALMLLQLVALKPQLAFLQRYQGHLLALQSGVNVAGAQWQHWFWVCVGGIAAFIPLIFVLKGRWSPARARRDEAEHEALVASELANLRSKMKLSMPVEQAPAVFPAER